MSVDAAVERLGLQPGEAVRFRRTGRARWQSGVVVGVERDGSLGIRDTDGAFRAVTLDAVLVRVRGARRWEPLLERAARTEQLSLALFDDAVVSGAGAKDAGRPGARRRAPRSGGATR